MATKSLYAAQLLPRAADESPVPKGLSARARLVSALCPAYPARLCDLRDAPCVFRIVGTLPDLARTVSIVGTRRADDEALDFAHDLGRRAALEGVVVVSGGAKGIDRAAHEGALDGGGRTLVVLPTGLDEPYPPEHGPLFERVAELGCLLTEVDDGQAPVAARFLNRNRLIAALGDRVVVVQAPRRSGALSTAAAGRRLGRPVFAVPASPWDPRGYGNLQLLRQGARICAAPGDVLSEAAPTGDGRRSNSASKFAEPSDFNTLTESEQTILAHLGSRARHADELSQRTGIAASEVQRSILQLLVRGWIEERPGGRVRRCRAGRKPY